MPETAVQGIRWMQKERGRAAAGHGCRNLLPNDSGLADAQHDHFASAFRQQVYRRIDVACLQARCGFGNRVGFRAQQLNDL